MKGFLQTFFGSLGYDTTQIGLDINGNDYVSVFFDTPNNILITRIDYNIDKDQFVFNVGDFRDPENVKELFRKETVSSKDFEAGKKWFVQTVEEIVGNGSVTPSV